MSAEPVAGAAVRRLASALQPRVSVIIPAHNANTLDRTLESLSTQRFHDGEATCATLPAASHVATPCRRA